ncbi:hypothetical protein Glove_253g26 [Diversispora epigaea]|uniref:Uncharacterized protein n=1 Tax=Diversispora epigaea TaxID=1348612 RepID=A0A397I9P7_9GLOM|nr:hypothetical protein Glove_253g26 [Diversispora epigaea]
MKPMISELNDLITNELKDSIEKIWTTILYFSSDWKFLSIILDFNSSNNMNQINIAFLNNNKSLPGHIKSSLLPMILLNYYIPDEFHVIHVIKTIKLIIQELKIQNQFNDSPRTKIIVKMCRISVSFYFWQDQGIQNWTYTSSSGII